MEPFSEADGSYCNCPDTTDWIYNPKLEIYKCGCAQWNYNFNPTNNNCKEKCNNRSVNDLGNVCEC